jgi:hypothetical protein
MRQAKLPLPHPAVPLPPPRRLTRSSPLSSRSFRMAVALLTMPMWALRPSPLASPAAPDAWRSRASSRTHCGTQPATSTGFESRSVIRSSMLTARGGTKRRGGGKQHRGGGCQQRPRWRAHGPNILQAAVHVEGGGVLSAHGAPLCLAGAMSSPPHPLAQPELPSPPVPRTDSTTDLEGRCSMSR